MNSIIKTKKTRTLLITALSGIFLSDVSSVSATEFSEKNTNEYCSNTSCAEDFKKELEKANKGDTNSESKVGEMLHFGKGVKQNYAEALKWYLKATEKKHAESALYVGRMYLMGEGVSKNKIEACNWYVKSGKWGHVWGMMNAASCYKHGIGGFPKDEKKANEWYAKAEKVQPGIYKENEKKIRESMQEGKKTN